MTGLTYFKRYRMEMDLREPLPPEPALPDPYFFVPWEAGLSHRHAEVKHAAFRAEMDAAVFPSFLSLGGCRQLMEAICRGDGFVPGATWLLACGAEFVATVQGVRNREGVGAVQNLGVIPSYRGLGLGLALMLKALRGFQSAGVHKAMLEVTARNTAAVQLYRRLGFRCRRTVYKPVQPVPAVAEFAGQR